MTQHMIVISDDEMLDELARRIATQLAGQVTEHYSELQSHFDKLTLHILNLTDTMRTLINKLPHNGDIAPSPDDLLN